MTGLPVNEALVNAVQACCNWHHAPEESKAATDAGYPYGFGDNLTIFTGAGDDTGSLPRLIGVPEKISPDLADVRRDSCLICDWRPLEIVLKKLHQDTAAV